MLPKKLPFPDSLLVTNVKIEVEQEGISEEGEPLVDFIFEGKCIYSQKTKKTMTKEGQLIDLEGTIILKGDIAPKLKITAGKVIVDGHVMYIYRCKRPGNPDGTIHHTSLEVV